MSKIALCCAAFLFLLAGCATSAPPVTWVRADGRPPAPKDVELRRLECRGEAYKGSGPQQAALVMADSLAGVGAAGMAYQNSMEAIMQGCMAKYGYVEAKAR